MQNFVIFTKKKYFLEWSSETSPISKDGLITLSQKEIITTAATGKRQRIDDTPTVKRKGTTSNDFLEFIIARSHYNWCSWYELQASGAW